MKLILLLIFTALFNVGLAQSPPLRVFSVKEGMPSGIVYDCLEDRSGFMWFATEAGLVRFDGINFKTYTTEHGLSNNSILQIIEDDDGSIWIFPFGTSPCIFDWKQQRIITVKEEPVLAELGKYAEHLSAIKNEAGILIYADYILYMVDNRKLVKLRGEKDYNSKPFYYTGDSLYVITVRESTERRPVMLEHFSRENGIWKNLYSDTINFPDETFYFASSLNRAENIGNYKVFTNPHGFSAYKVGNWSNPDLRLAARVVTKGRINSIRKSGNYIYVCTTAGILKYNMDFTLSEALWPEHPASKFFQDSRGNKWYCMLDGSGVFMTLGNGVMTISRTEGLPAENISAINMAKPGTLLMGDANGGIGQLTWERRRTIFASLAHFKSGIRQLLKTEKGTLFLADKELALVDDKKIRIKEIPEFALKCAVMLNKDFILFGHSAGLHKIDLNLDSMELLTGQFTRFSTITGLADTLYFGNNKGLFYTPAYSKMTYETGVIKTTAVTEPVTAVNFTPDGILWVGTNTQGIIVYRNNKINTRVPYNAAGGSYLIKKIFPEPDKKRVWVATNKGVQLIKYDMSGDSVVTSSRFITARDGLADDDVNDVIVSRDTVFAATIKGISYFPDTLKATVIPISITGITLNDKDSTLPAAASYSIKYSKSSFSVRYSGICYTCDGKIMYRYRLLGPDRDTNWISTPVNTVEFGALQPGRYVFQVTTDASDVTETVITITPAFWQKSWFYILLVLAAAMVSLLAVRWYIRRLKRSNEKRIAQNKKLSELELRALQSQMNPHFIFNSMNSLQKFILTNDIPNANEYLAGFSKLLRLFLDASRSRFITVSRETELLRLYIELEQMRQMTKFSYEMKIDESVNPEMLIPSVIIQPFVENAVVHGLRYLEDRPGKLKIEMAMKEGLFTCTIEDNGVGRKKVKEIQQQKAQQYKSYGTAIIEEKIETLHKMENIDIKVNIADRESVEGTGTIVTITYKPQGNI